MTTLVAGIGNVFLGDDGFGVEVVRRLSSIDPGDLPPGVDLADYGIRGVHLAYELLGGRYDTLVLIDAVPLDAEPGTVVIMDASDVDWSGHQATLDAHSMSPDVVLRTLHRLGGRLDRIVVVGCRPAVLEERMGLSEPVAAAVDEAVRLTLDLIDSLTESPMQPAQGRRT